MQLMRQLKAIQIFTETLIALILFIAVWTGTRLPLFLELPVFPQFPGGKSVPTFPGTAYAGFQTTLSVTATGQ